MPLAPLQVTDARDGSIPPRMYSYWSNAVVRDGLIDVFCGGSDGRPQFFQVDPRSRSVERLGSLTVRYTGETEGWYWDAAAGLYLIDGPRLHHLDPRTGDDRVVVDISVTWPGCVLWQAHSSDDGRVHAATVRQIVPDGPYPPLGTIVAVDGQERYFAGTGALDESHLSANGRWLLIEDSDDLWIHDLAELGVPPIVIRDADGALSHLDVGADFAVGEDNVAGACVRLDLATLERRELFRTNQMGHVSVRGDRCLLSDVRSLSLVALDGSGLTPLAAHGMVSDGTYDTQVKANLSPCGRVATFMSNQGTDRQDVFLLIDPALGG